MPRRLPHWLTIRQLRSDGLLIFDPNDGHLINPLTVAARAHFLDPDNNERCVCGRWVEGDDWDEHLVRAILWALKREVHGGC